MDVTTFQNDMTSFSSRDDVLTYLIHLGYLAYDQVHRRAFVPNEEIRQELTRAVKKKRWKKQYPDMLLDYTGNILMVGINYDKKSKKHECMIEAYRNE